MNVDRLPDGRDDDPERATDTARLTESAIPETPPPADNTSRAEPSPELEQRPPPDRLSQPERDQQPQATKDVATAEDSEARGSVEPRSRQEHADPPVDTPDCEAQRQVLTDEKGSNGDSDAQQKHVPNPDPRSPYEDSVEPDGEAAEPVRPHTEQERAEHITDAFARLDKADNEGFSSNELHTIDSKGEIWSSDRTLLHQSLLDDIYSHAADVPCNHEAIVAGGLSGAGKTTVLADHPEIDRSKYLTINPDAIKEEMARSGLIPEVEGLSPMEASELVHEESSHLARQLAIRAQGDGKNLIWDITMSDLAKTQQRITSLRESGYTKVDAIFVQIPIETSLRRTEARYWEDQDKWFAGEGLGGRLIPPEVILRQADEEWGSGNRKTFEAIKEIVNSWEIKDNSIDGFPATLVDRSEYKDAASKVRKEQGL